MNNEKQKDSIRILEHGLKQGLLYYFEQRPSMADTVYSTHCYYERRRTTDLIKDYVRAIRNVRGLL